MLPLFIFYSDFNCLGSITDTVSKNDLYPAGLNTAWNSNEYLVHKLTTGSAETIKSLDSAGKCVSGTLSETSESNHHSVSDPLYFNSGDSWAWIRISQATPFHHSALRIDYHNAEDIGSYHVHAYQSENLDDCTTVGGHYDPLYAQAASYGDYPSFDEMDPYRYRQHDFEIGDLSGKHGDFGYVDYAVTPIQHYSSTASRIYYDVNLPIWGKNSVAGRSVVLHKSTDGSRAACGNLGHLSTKYDSKPEIDEIKIDYSGLTEVEGYQIFQQVKNCPSCQTTVKSNLRYKFDEAAWNAICSTSSLPLYSSETCEGADYSESKFHIHTIRDGVNEWTGCANNGGHYNPQRGVPCDNGYQGDYQDLCEVGDLNNKIGLLKIGKTEFFTEQKTDIYAPLSDENGDYIYAFAEKSITIHAPNGDRMLCGPTDLN